MLTLYDGDLGAGITFPDQVKTDFLYLSLEKMKYDYFNLGEEDFLYGLDYLKDKIKSNPIFISANLIDNSTQKTFVDPYKIKTFTITLENKKKIKINIAVFGLLGSSQTFQTQLNLKSDSTQFTLASPQETAEKLLPELKKKSDIIVCLAHMTPSEADNLAQKVPGIDIIISGHDSYQMVGNPRLVGRTIIVNNGDRGRYGGLLELRFDEKKQIINYRGKEAPLSADFADDTDMVELINNYKKAVAVQPVQSSITPTPATPPVDTNLKFSGSKSCQVCHAKEYAVWEKSAHPTAFVTLKKKSKDKTADCLKCHTLGFGQPTGFVSEEKTPLLAGIHCESCHGIGSAHVNAPPDKKKVTIERSRGAATCLICHDRDNDPKFNYAKAMAKIKHWK